VSRNREVTMKRVPMIVLSSVLLVAAIGGATEPTNRATTPQAESAPPVEKAAIDKTQVVPSLMVQSAKGYTYRDGKLTLEGISPTTITFADRPVRLAGSVPTDSFVADWSEGRDSFEKVPPNADFSSFDKNGVQNAVVELKNPQLKGDALTYDVRVLKGRLAPSGNESALFIDIIGMPMTPLSFAGVARRSARRAAYWSAVHPAYVAPAAVAVPGPHAIVY
jgi:hypothetical protein